ncbi:MAG: sensor histidine kinase [Burkholderiales bacterium]
MKSLTDTIRHWWRELVARKLASLPPDQRDDVIAFERQVRRYKWRCIGAVLAVWLLAAVCFRVYAKDASWLESFVLMFLLLAAVAWGVMSVWFDHPKFRGGWRSAIWITGLTVGGAVCGALLARYQTVGSFGAIFDDPTGLGGRVLLGGFIAGVIYSLGLLAVLHVRRRTLQARNEELRRQVESERLARQLADARLRLMQAQVEPHFLFNTLASVQQLAEGKAPEAAQLARELIAFLRAGLAGLRDDSVTLEREFAMVAAYLAIMQTRMGERLSFRLNLPEALRNRAVPPAMLISLVENAIKHGLEPSTSGGTLSISAREVLGNDNTTLIIEVRDTGLGLGAGMGTTPGGGVGLSNVRERLEAIYGERARLQIEENLPRGVIAVIEIAEFKPREASTHRVASSFRSVM